MEYSMSFNDFEELCCSSVDAPVVSSSPDEIDVITLVDVVSPLSPGVPPWTLVEGFRPPIPDFTARVRDDFKTSTESFSPVESPRKGPSFVKKVTKFVRRKSKVAPADNMWVGGDLNSESVPEEKQQRSTIGGKFRNLARTAIGPYAGRDRKYKLPSYMLPAAILLLPFVDDDFRFAVDGPKN